MAPDFCAKAHLVLGNEAVPKLWSYLKSNILTELVMYAKFKVLFDGLLIAHARSHYIYCN